MKRKAIVTWRDGSKSITTEDCIQRFRVLYGPLAGGTVEILDEKEVNHETKD